MLNYFRELLLTLKRIESHLERLASCVRDSGRGYGDNRSLSTKHWND